MPRPTFIHLLPAAALIMLAAGGCSSSSSSVKTPKFEEGAIIHHVTEADLATTKGKYALTTDTATLWVNGLGCPQCASNIDIQLLRVQGVSDVKVDLSTGKVAIAMADTSSRRPSPNQLAAAVEDAGFTLAKIETP